MIGRLPSTHGYSKWYCLSFVMKTLNRRVSEVRKHTCETQSLSRLLISYPNIYFFNYHLIGVATQVRKHMYVTQSLFLSRILYLKYKLYVFLINALNFFSVQQMAILPIYNTSYMHYLRRFI